MVRIVAGIEVGSKDKGYNCKALFLGTISDALYRFVYNGASTIDITVGYEAIKGRGFPGDISWPVRETWEKKEYPSSGSGCCWMSLPEVRELADRYAKAFGEKDTFLLAVLSQMEELERVYSTKTRLIFWGELEDSPK